VSGRSIIHSDSAPRENSSFPFHSHTQSLHKDKSAKRVTTPLMMPRAVLLHSSHPVCERCAHGSSLSHARCSVAQLAYTHVTYSDAGATHWLVACTSLARVLITSA
jgi:hypothetical protein